MLELDDLKGQLVLRLSLHGFKIRNDNGEDFTSVWLRQLPLLSFKVHRDEECKKVELEKGERILRNHLVNTYSTDSRNLRFSYTVLQDKSTAPRLDDSMQQPLLDIFRQRQFPNVQYECHIILQEDHDIMGFELAYVEFRTLPAIPRFPVYTSTQRYYMTYRHTRPCFGRATEANSLSITGHPNPQFLSRWSSHSARSGPSGTRHQDRPGTRLSRLSVDALSVPSRKPRRQTHQQ